MEEGVDHDGDGSLVSEDCDDTDPSVYPGAPDPDCDGVDHDCDGLGTEAFRLDDGSTFDTLDDAISTAHDGDMIWVCDGQHPTAVNLDRGYSFELESWSGDPERAMLVGDGDAPILRFGRQATVAIRGVGFSGANVTDGGHGAGAAVSMLSGSMTIENGVFRSNYSKSGGAAIGVKTQTYGDDTYLSIADVVFENNVSGENAGAILLQSQGDPLEAQIADSTFLQNEAAVNGGALVVESTGTSLMSAVLEGCSFESNVAGTDGGAISVHAGTGGAALSISDAVFLSNVAGETGGDIDFGVGSPGTNSAVNIADSSFDGGFAGHTGGSVVLSGTFWGNSGALDAELSGVTISSSSAEDWAGGLLVMLGENEGTSVVLRDTVITGATVPYGASSLYLYSDESTPAEIALLDSAILGGAVEQPDEVDASMVETDGGFAITSTNTLFDRLDGTNSGPELVTPLETYDDVPDGVDFTCDADGACVFE